jgi:hypothetical protein
MSDMPSLLALAMAELPLAREANICSGRRWSLSSRRRIPAGPTTWSALFWRLLAWWLESTSIWRSRRSGLTRETRSSDPKHGKVIGGHTEKCAPGGRFRQTRPNGRKTKGGVEAEMTKPLKNTSQHINIAPLNKLARSSAI